MAAKEAAIATKKMAMDKMSILVSYLLLVQGIVHPLLITRGNMLSNKKEIHLRSKRKLLGRIVPAMDGMRWNDELACMFKHPIKKLIEMLRSTGRWDVISVCLCTD